MDSLRPREIMEKMSYSIFFITIALILIGIVFVFSSSYYVTAIYEVGNYYFFIRQIIWAVVSVGVMFFFIFFDYHRLKKVVKPLVFLTFTLLLAVFVPGVGHESGGAMRWIDLKFASFNPSELAKITVIIYLSYILTKKQGKLADFKMGLLPPLLVVAAIFFVILMQSGFSTAVILLLVSFVLFFVGGASMKHILSITIASIPVLIFFIVKVAYRLDRIFAYLDPWEDAGGKGYHLIQSLKAFSNGGFLGQGLGNSVQKVKYLPTPHTDFIFAVIGEEMGLWGCILLIGLFFLFFINGVMIAYRTKDSFGQLLAFGMTLLITLHAILNMSIAVGLTPPTGVSLPFISYGGSAILMMSVAVGILLNISAQNDAGQKFEMEDVEDLVQEGF